MQTEKKQEEIVPLFSSRSSPKWGWIVSQRKAKLTRLQRWPSHHCFWQWFQLPSYASWGFCGRRATSQTHRRSRLPSCHQGVDPCHRCSPLTRPPSLSRPRKLSHLGTCTIFHAIKKRNHDVFPFHDPFWQRFQLWAVNQMQEYFPPTQRNCNIGRSTRCVKRP